MREGRKREVNAAYELYLQFTVVAVGVAVVMRRKKTRQQTETEQ